MQEQPSTRGVDLAAISAIVNGWVREGGQAGLAAQVAGWGSADWAAARWAIQVHGIGPLLEWRLAGTAEASAVQPLVREYLAAQRRLSRERVELLLGDLAEVLEASAASGVEVLPLKGSLLASQYYPELGLRPMNDLDVLIRPSDEPRVLQLLASLGYQPLCRSSQHILVARLEHYGPTVVWDGEHPANPRSIDVHTRLHEQFWGIRYDLTAHAWADSVGGRLLGSPARLLGPAALLHHLAVHATGDLIARWGRLVQLHDIGLVAAQVDEPGWARIVASAQAQREERFLYPALALAQHYYGGVPPRVLQDLRAGVPPKLLDYLDRSTLEQLSLCNALPSTITEKLRWFRPGREWLRAISHILIPKPADVALPHLQQPLMRTLQEYTRHYTDVLRWIIRRVRHMPRDKLISYMADPAINNLQRGALPPSANPIASGSEPGLPDES